VLRYDGELSHLGTQWILHFFLVSQHTERSLVWHRCFNEYLSLTAGFTAEELQTFVERDLELTPSNKQGISKDSRECIKTYTDPIALGSLGLLAKLDRQRIAVGQPVMPDPLIVAFVLFDSWSRLFGREGTVRLSQIAETPEMIG